MDDEKFVLEASKALELYREISRHHLRPTPRVPVSAWADQHRFLDSSSPEPGQWRTSRTPFLAEIMDSLSPHSEVERVVLMKAAQIGGTEILLNFAGFIMDVNPGPA